MKKKWHAVYTKAHGEIKAAALLTKKRIENYCPLNKLVLTEGAKSKIVYEPLFSCFVFVCILDSEIQIVKQIGCVLNFAYWLGEPVVIMDTEIEKIKHFTNQHYNIKIEKAIVKGNKVRIYNNQSNDINITDVSVTDLQTKILLPSLGFNLVADMEITTIDTFGYSFDRNQMVY